MHYKGKSPCEKDAGLLRFRLLKLYSSTDFYGLNRKWNSRLLISKEQSLNRNNILNAYWLERSFPNATADRVFSSLLEKLLANNN